MINQKGQEFFGKKFSKICPSAKGQAFSVFELMIAAIVAIAILFVLLPIIGGIITPTGNPVDAIGNALSSVPAGTSSDTQAFEVKRDQALNTQLFTNKGIDPCSVYFDAKAFGDGSDEGQLTVETALTTPDEDSGAQCTSRFRNTTTGSVRAKATVVCDTSPAALESTLAFVGLDEKINIQPNDSEAWGDEEDPGFDKVCIVILKRA